MSLKQNNLGVFLFFSFSFFLQNAQSSSFGFLSLPGRAPAFPSAHQFPSAPTCCFIENNITVLNNLILGSPVGFSGVQGVKARILHIENL